MRGTVPVTLALASEVVFPGCQLDIATAELLFRVASETRTRDPILNGDD